MFLMSAEIYDSIASEATLVSDASFQGKADSTANEEIDFLIRMIGNSNFTFIRNGKDYTAKEGAAHMREKLRSAGYRVKTSEEFIEKIATRSSLSGEPYILKTPEGKKISTGHWLTEMLVEYRSSKVKIL